DDTSLATKSQVEEFDQRMHEWEKATKPLREVIDSELADERKAAKEEAESAYDPETQKAIDTPAEQRSCLQKQLVEEAEKWIESRVARAYKRCSPEERKQYDKQMTELATFDKLKPEPLPTAMTITDGDGQAPTTCVLEGGNY